MIIKYLNRNELESFWVDSSELSTKEIISKLWKMIVEKQAYPQGDKFWIYDDNDNYIAVVETKERKQINYIKNNIFTTPKEIIQNTGINIKWDKNLSLKFVKNILFDWKYEYYLIYGIRNFYLDIDSFNKQYKKFVNTNKKYNDLSLILSYDKFHNLSEKEQSNIKHKYSAYFISDYNKIKFRNKDLTLYEYIRNKEFYETYDNIILTDDNFYPDYDKIKSEINKIENSGLDKTFSELVKIIKSDKKFTDNILANYMIQTTEDLLIFRQFGLHSGFNKNQNYEGFVSCSTDYWRSNLGKSYDNDKVERFILPKGFWYIPNIDRCLEPGEILIWNQNLCKL